MCRILESEKIQTLKLLWAQIFQLRDTHSLYECYLKLFLNVSEFFPGCLYRVSLGWSTFVLCRC